MKVVHITQNDTNGAGVAALRIVQAQRSIGIDAHLIVRDKNSDYEYVHSFYYFKYIDFLIYKMMHFIGGDYLFSLNSLKIINSKLFKDADIVHIHNIHYTRMLHPWQLPKKKKYVYTLHDMWAITGFCNYTFNLCERFLTGCYNCPLNKDEKNYGFRKMFIDTSRLNWMLKKYVYSKLNIVFTAPSTWLYTLAGSSEITNSKPVKLVPNCLQVEELPNKIIKDDEPVKLLFVGQKLVQNDRKGFGYIVEVCNMLDIPHQINIVGKVTDETKNLFRNKLTKLVFYNSVNYEQLKQIYKDSDILLLPTQQDNLPNTILESFACRTPVVAFDIGGISDLVCDSTGYLANYRSSEDMIKGIRYVKDNLIRLSNDAYEYSKNYSFKNVATQFKSIYNEII